MSKMKTFLSTLKTREKIKRVLFVCKHNRFRSKVAEAFFKKYNKKPGVKAESAAIKPDYIPVSKNVVKALKEIGINKVNRKPRKLNSKILNKADLVVVVADDVNRKFSKKIIVWKIKDTNQSNFSEILKITKEIKKRVLNLLAHLKNQ